MQSVPLRDDIVPVATIRWSESDGGGSSDVGFADGSFFLDRLAPMEDPALLSALDDEGAVTWATQQVRDWYYNTTTTSANPTTPPPGALRMGAVASAFIFFGYVLAGWSCWYFGIEFLGDREFPLTVLGVVWTVLTDPYVWPALILSWAGDLLISDGGQASSSGRALVFRGHRFFHGPLVTVAFACALLIGVASAVL